MPAPLACMQLVKVEPTGFGKPSHRGWLFLMPVLLAGAGVLGDQSRARVDGTCVCTPYHTA